MGFIRIWLNEFRTVRPEEARSLRRLEGQSLMSIAYMQSPHLLL
jgi:hypothetical protein